MIHREHVFPCFIKPLYYFLYTLCEYKIILVGLFIYLSAFLLEIDIFVLKSMQHWLDEKFNNQQHCSFQITNTTPNYPGLFNGRWGRPGSWTCPARLHILRLPAAHGRHLGGCIRHRKKLLCLATCAWAYLPTT